MLNAKQEKFVQNIVKGMSQRQAYKDAFGAEYDDNAIDSNASTLFNSAKVQQRYKELMDKLEDEAIMSAKERRIWLTKVITGEEQEEVYATIDDISIKVGSKNADLSTKMKAMDILNKMDGEYIEKLKVGNDDPDKPFEVNINVVK